MQVKNVFIQFNNTICMQVDYVYKLLFILSTLGDVFFLPMDY